MILSVAEKLAMNNPVRAAFQRRYEARKLLRLGGPVPGGRVLEMGCGRGVGSEIILTAFGAQSVDAFDLDPHMAALARKRLARFGDRARVATGDAEKIEAAADTYDAVFDFGIIHHVPGWKRAVAEAFRVLKPGGRFYTEEVYVSFVAHPLVKALADHPREAWFTHERYGGALAEAGFSILGHERFLNLFGWFVAEKPEGSS